MDIKALKSALSDAIDNCRNELNEVSQYLWDNPELNFEEKLAHEKLTNFLELHEFEVKRSHPIATAFIAYYGDPSGMKIGLICEYDALPGIGHACGHNLIAEAGLASAVGLQHVLKSNPELKVQIIVYGTPAEEMGGGKVVMIDHGCFKEADICMMVHPFIVDLADPPLLAAQDVKLEFFGKASHASAAPWEGVNALDAAVQCYNAVSMMRQQLKPTTKIHGVISHGGDKPNIIPERTEMEFVVRDISKLEMNKLMEKLISCAEASAKSTGCTLKISKEHPYYDLISNKILVSYYKENVTALGVELFSGPIDRSQGASSDMGNVSYVTPSIHPIYRIPTKEPNHTKGFTVASGAESAQEPTFIAAKAIAMTALDVICNKDAIKLIKEDFNLSLKEAEK